MASMSAAEPMGEAHVVVSDAMRALFRASRGLPPPDPPPEAVAPAEPPAPETRPHEPAAEADPVATDPAPLPIEGPWQTLCLRRDGARPLRFDGQALLMREATTVSGIQDAPLTHRFELFLASSGGLVGSLSLTSPPEGGARPVHTVRPLDGPEHIAKLLSAHDPARGLVAWADPTAGTLREAARLGDQLRADARALVAAALAALPLAPQSADGE